MRRKRGDCASLWHEKGRGTKSGDTPAEGGAGSPIGSISRSFAPRGLPWVWWNPPVRENPRRSRASIHRGVVPPNRRLPPTNDFFGASTGSRSGQTVARCSPASSYLGFAMIGVRVGVMKVPCDFSTSTCEPLARTWPPTDDRVAGIFFFVNWSPKRNPSLSSLFARRLTRATFRFLLTPNASRTSCASP